MTLVVVYFYSAMNNKKSVIAMTASLLGLSSLFTIFGLTVYAQDVPPIAALSAQTDNSKLVGHSIKPSAWIYSENKTLACRVKEWSSYPLESRVVFEFSNLKSRGRVNIVYDVIAKDKDGNVIRLFNEYTDRQTNITDFKGGLKQRQSRRSLYIKKYASPIMSVALQGCRVAKQDESFFTINPEMKGYQGP